MGHGVVVQDVRHNSSFEIAWQRKWEHLAFWYIAVVYLLANTGTTIDRGTNCKVLAGSLLWVSHHIRSCVTKLPVLAILAQYWLSTDGSIASISRTRGCYVSCGIIITIVSYLWYLYLVLEKNALHEKRKKSVFPRIMYVHAECIRGRQQPF